MEFKTCPKIAVIGLGYVGLPLAVALARYFPVMGFDINESRIQELKNGYDRTREINKETLEKTTLQFMSDSPCLKNQDVYIVTVPTPVTVDNLPDLEAIKKASITVGKVLSAGAVVVFESTVYPGVTEDVCGPILEQYSGLTVGKDFYLGYSPERINPGDKEHTIDKITKVVAGQTPEVATFLKMIYGKLNQNNIFVAKNIKTAEAAKVIENAQRDINIAFINEIATIMGKCDLSIYDVLAAANTKWNFLNFQPGLVGGHCIGVDPYYLAYCARMLSYEPEVILAGRRINENMGEVMARLIHQKLLQVKASAKKHKILVLGLSFKEDIPDLRNSKVIDIITHLRKQDHEVHVHDTFADPNEAKVMYDLPLLKSLETLEDFDCIIAAVAHQEYKELSSAFFQKHLREEGLIADIKNIWRDKTLPKKAHYLSL